jgi:hypothetical protein
MMLTEIGIIPRAASVLFEKLDGPNNRALGSGIRAPSRLSGLGSAQALNSKSSANKNWQLKATYVEVRTMTMVLIAALTKIDLQ